MYWSGVRGSKDNAVLSLKADVLSCLGQDLNLVHVPIQGSFQKLDRGEPHIKEILGATWKHMWLYYSYIQYRQWSYRCHCYSLHIGHGGGTAKDTYIGREGRLQARLALLPFQTLNQSLQRYDNFASLPSSPVCNKTTPWTLYEPWFLNYMYCKQGRRVWECTVSLWIQYWHP